MKQEGVWATPPAFTKAHYFREGMALSICRKVAITGAEHHEQRFFGDKANCTECRSILHTAKKEATL